MKENQRVMLTKRLLKESLIELMAEEDTEYVSVTKLCQKAGINRTTFYHHYYDTNDVLKEIKDNMIKDMQNILNQQEPQNGWNLKEQTTAICEYLKENRKIAIVLFKGTSTESGFAQDLFEIAQSFTKSLHFSNLIEDKEYKNLLFSFLMNGIYSLISYWLVNDVKKTPEEMGELIYEISTKGWVRKN